MSVNVHLKEVLFTEEKIAAKVEEIGRQITRDYLGRDLLIVCVLKGAMPFTADLIRRIELPLEMDTIVASSYGSSTKSSGAVRIMKDLERGIEGRNVIIVEDIIDTGLTLNYLKDNLLARKPASLKICSFLDKPSRRKVDLKPDYCGFGIPDEFVVGYGLDYAEKYRNLPYVGVLAPEVYS